MGVLVLGTGRYAQLWCVACHWDGAGWGQIPFMENQHLATSEVQARKGTGISLSSGKDGWLQDTLMTSIVQEVSATLGLSIRNKPIDSLLQFAFLTYFRICLLNIFRIWSLSFFWIYFCFPQLCEKFQSREFLVGILHEPLEKLII